MLTHHNHARYIQNIPYPNPCKVKAEAGQGIAFEQLWQGEKRAGAEELVDSLKHNCIKL